MVALLGAEPELGATADAAREFYNLAKEAPEACLEAGGVMPLVELLSAGPELKVTEYAAGTLILLCGNE